MTAVKISDLPAETAPSLSSVIPESNSGTTYKMTPQQIYDLTVSLNNNSSPTSSDVIPVYSQNDGETDGITITELAIVVAANAFYTINPQTADYTVALTDNGAIVTNTSASDITITLPQQSDVALPAGFSVILNALSTGTITIAVEGSDVLIGNTTVAASGGLAFAYLNTADTISTWVTGGAS